MNDGLLLIFGCGVTLIAFAGAYVYLRESFTNASEREKIETREDVAAREAVEVHL